MKQLARHIAIVGGGTAGWLAALILGDGARRAGIDIGAAKVDSAKFPSMGIGEGGTAVFRQMLRSLGLDGLGLLDREVERRELAAGAESPAHARETTESLAGGYSRAALKTLGHRKLLQGFAA